MQITQQESGSRLRIAGTLDISVAENLQKALNEFVNGSARLMLDLSPVETCDTATLQLLCSARKTAESLGKSLQLAGLSSEVRAVGAAIGLPLEEWAADRDTPGGACITTKDATGEGASGAIQPC